MNKIKLSTLTPADYNPRTMDEESMNRLMMLIAEHTKAVADWNEHEGLRLATTITVNRQGNRIVGGHQRCEALRLLEQDWIHEDDVTWVDLAPDSPEEKALNVALNSQDASGEYDYEKLGALLRDIELSPLDVSLTGLAEETLKPFLVEPFDGGDGGGGGGGDEPPNKAEELQEKWGTESGQMWKCGEHRIVCGDCTDPAVVERVMGGEKAQLLFTDPPYGVSYADKNAFLNAAGKGNQTPEEMQGFWTAAFGTVVECLEPGACYYVTGPSGDILLPLLVAMKDAGMPMRHGLVWAKNNHVLGRTDYNYKHEMVLYGWVDGGHKFYGDFDTSLWEIARPQSSDLHPTTKPVELYERGIRNSSQDGEVVLDPFVGSGTCIVACERLGRKARGCEISPAYVAVCLERFFLETGDLPELVE